MLIAAGPLTFHDLGRNIDAANRARRSRFSGRGARDRGGSHHALLIKLIFFGLRGLRQPIAMKAERHAGFKMRGREWSRFDVWCIKHDQITALLAATIHHGQ